jgi:uncharacterized protein
MELNGRTALLTGATGGLGQALARALYSRGVFLTLTGRRADVLEPLAEEVKGKAYVCDLSNPKEVEKLAKEYADVDILICNAGSPGSGKFDSFSVKEIDRVIDVNLRSPMTLARIIGQQMMERRVGHIVFISSMSGKVSTPGSSIYSATKFGLRGFSFGLREDLASANVGVSVVSPGFVRDAGMFHDAEGMEEAIPSFVGTSSPEDVNNAVIKAIEHNRAEIVVAPALVRAGGTIASMAPGFFSKLQRRFGAQDISEKMAEKQMDKRS